MSPTSPVIRLGVKAYRLQGYPEIPDLPAKGMVDELERDARKGESHAALLIYLKLNECVRAARDQGDPDALLVAAESLGSVDAAMKEENHRLQQCEGLTQADYERGGDWLAMAADLGNPLAQVIYSFVPEVVAGSMANVIREPERLVDYKRQAMAHLQRAAANGNVNALERLSQIYSDGFLAPANPVAARAYELAASRADPEIPPRGPDGETDPLDAAQRAEASRMAKEIYRECCENQ